MIEDERQILILKHKIRLLEAELTTVKAVAQRQQNQIQSLNRMVDASNDFCLKLEHVIQNVSGRLENVESTLRD